MKTCISTYSFAPLIDNKKLTYFEVLDKIKELGAEGAEVKVAEYLICISGIHKCMHNMLLIKVCRA